MIKKDTLSFNSFKDKNWNRYLDLEEQLFNYKYEVEFDSENNDTYSSHILDMLLSICSEVDNVVKIMARHCNPNINVNEEGNNKFEKFNKWWDVIKNIYPLLKDDDWFHYNNHNSFELVNIYDKKCVLTCNNEIVLYPWKDRSWWNDYSLVKHNRSGKNYKDNKWKINFMSANLKNVLSACAGLYLLNIAFMMNVGTDKQLSEITRISKLFDDSSGIRMPTMTDDEIENILDII